VRTTPARAERGLSNNKVGNFKQSFKASYDGPITRSTFKMKNKAAKDTAKLRTARDISQITRRTQS
jgi:hypothetical protein